MRNYNATQLAIAASNYKKVSWLFTVVDSAGPTAYYWSTITRSYSGQDYTYKIDPKSFRGIELNSTNTEHNIVSPSDLSFIIENSGNVLTASDFIGGTVLVDLIISDGTNEETMVSCKYRIKRCEAVYQTLKFTCENLIQEYLDDDYPTTTLVKDIIPSNDPDIDDGLCVPVPIGQCYIPLRSLYISDQRYYLLGLAGNVYDITRVRSPRKWGVGTSEWGSASYSFIQSTQTIDSVDWRVFQTIIADSDGDGVADANGLWQQGDYFLDMPTQFTKDNTRWISGNQTGAHDGADNASTLSDSGASWGTDKLIGAYVINRTDGSYGLITDNDATTVTATLTGGTDNDWDAGDEYTVGGPASCIKWICEDKGISSSIIDDTSFAIAEKTFASWGLTFNGPYDHKKPFRQRIALLLLMCHSTLQFTDKVELHVLSKTSQKTVTKADVLRTSEIGPGTFNYSLITQKQCDSGYIEFQVANESQDKFIKKLVLAKDTANNISSSILRIPFVQDTQDVQRIGTLKYQREFTPKANISFTNKAGSLLAVQPDDVITINADDYGGTYPVVVKSMLIKHNQSELFSIDFQCTQYSVDLDDWEDLSPAVISIGQDDSTVAFNFAGNRVFSVQPYPPYDVGDLWAGGLSGDIKRCITPRASGSYAAEDWELASKYDKTSDQFAQSLETIDSATVNFNGRNDRDNAAITVPAITTDGTAIDHTLNTDSSADISFEWSWAGAESDIDGFVVYVRGSTSSASYDFGTTPSEEITFYCRPDRRHFTLKGVAANLYWTFGVSAYRIVDPDVNTNGFIATAIIQPSASGEDPYQPSANVAFAGNITGTVNDKAVSSVVYHDGSVIKRTDGTGVDADSLPESTTRRWAGETGATIGAIAGTNLKDSTGREIDDDDIITGNALSYLGGQLPNWNLNLVDSENKPAGIHAVESISNRSQLFFGDAAKNYIRITNSPDNTVAYGFPAIPIDDKQKYSITIRHYSSIDTDTGLYLRFNELNTNLPAGKTHVGSGGETMVAARTSIKSFVSVGPMPGTSWVEDTYTYTPTTGTKWASFSMYNYNAQSGGSDVDVDYFVDFVQMMLIAKTADDINYTDGTVVENLKPAEANSDKTGDHSADVDALATTNGPSQANADKTANNPQGLSWITGNATNIATISDAGWYRIAYNPGDRAQARFIVRCDESSRHNTAEFTAGVKYNNVSKLNFTLISFSLYSTQTLTKVRFLTKDTYDTQYLEIYVDNPGGDSDAYKYWLLDNIESSGWIAVDWTPGSIPDGYTSTEFGIGLNKVVDVTADNTAANIAGQGDLATQNVVTADQVNTTTLSAITANAGTVTAGVLENSDGTLTLDLTNGKLTVNLANGMEITASGGVKVTSGGDITFLSTQDDIAAAIFEGPSAQNSRQSFIGASKLSESMIFDPVPADSDYITLEIGETDNVWKSISFVGKDYVVFRPSVTDAGIFYIGESDYEYQTGFICWRPASTADNQYLVFDKTSDNYHLVYPNNDDEMLLGASDKRFHAGYFNELHGTLSDIKLVDKTCTICGEAFKKDDHIKFIVADTNEKGIRIVPVHEKCAGIRQHPTPDELRDKTLDKAAEMNIKPPEKPSGSAIHNK